MDTLALWDFSALLSAVLGKSMRRKWTTNHDPSLRGETHCPCRDVAQPQSRQRLGETVTTHTTSGQEAPRRHTLTKAVLSNRNRAGDLMLPDSEIYCKAVEPKRHGSGVETCGLTEQSSKPRKNSCIHGQWIFKEGERVVSSINDVGKLGIYMKIN